MKSKSKQGIQEWEKDIETEKLVVGKNQHTILHVCPIHATSCYKPLENTCEDCKLYISGKDIRQLLAQERKKAQVELIEKMQNLMQINKEELVSSGSTLMGEIIPLDKVLKILAALKEEVEK